MFLISKCLNNRSLRRELEGEKAEIVKKSTLWSGTRGQRARD